MPGSPPDRLLSSRFLGRLGLALILLFLVNSLFGLLPFKPFSAAWQLRVADLLRTTAPFTLLGAALIYLCEGPLQGDPAPLFPLQRIRRLAPLAALGFALLIPLQISASYLQIRDADIAAQKTIRSVQRRINEVRSVASDTGLLELSQGLPVDWQPLADASLDSNRARLLGRVEPELARLRTIASNNKNTAIQQSLRDGLRDLLLSLIYAVAFFGLRPARFEPLPLEPAGFQAADRPAVEGASPSGEDADISQPERHPWYP